MTQPGAVEQRLADWIGWTVHTPFADYAERARRQSKQWHRRTFRALGDIRPLDAQQVARWRAPEHRERLLSVLDELPELPEALVELGYEPDDAWTSRLA